MCNFYITLNEKTFSISVSFKFNNLIFFIKFVIILQKTDLFSILHLIQNLY